MVESTAAAMAYGLLVAGEKTVLIFDMGGGTLDLTIIHICDGKFEVMAVAGHSSCGGRIIDDLLFDYIIGYKLNILYIILYMYILEKF